MSLIFGAAAAVACLLGLGLYIRLSGRPVPEVGAAPVVRALPDSASTGLVIDVRALDRRSWSSTLPEEEREPAPALESGETSSTAKEWRMRGMIYDLISLKGIDGCTVVFFDSRSDARYKTSTAADGRYRTPLPGLARGGYTVTFSHPGYHTSYLMSGRGALSAISVAQRKKEARRLVGVINEPVELAASGDKPVESEFFLVPLKLSED